MAEPDDRPWYHDVKQYMQNGTYPDGASSDDRKTLRRLATQFFLCGELMFKRSMHGPLRCVDDAMAKRLMEEVHEGTCGPHMSGHALAKKILRTGYFWQTMTNDCISFVRHCHQCQIHGDVLRAPPKELQVMTSPWPFSAWGMDVIGEITPKSSGGHRFILVAIDYFTKWVEAVSLASVTQKQVARFLKHHIICRHGMPEALITDNAKNLNGRDITKLCAEFGINHRNSTIYRPQMNGAVEAANKNIKRIIRKMTDTNRNWDEKLPYALMAYRTSIRSSTGATPYSLVYGHEAVLPAEIEIPTLRVLMETELEDAEWVKSRYDQLCLLDEKRLAAIYHSRCYQNRISRAFNKFVRPRNFKVGDLVLKRILPIQNEAKGKFAPNYQGPFRVSKVLSGGALILSEMDGEEFPQPLNADTVKHYFV
jgi:hypothetical protein